MVLQSAEEYKEKGNAAYHDRDYATAAQFYGKAIAADPDNGVYYNNRAAAYLELKKYAEASADAERSAILAPSAKANARHGKALWLLGRTAEAATAYERALRHDSENPEYKDALHRLKIGGGEPSYAAGAAPRGPNAARATESYRMGLDAAIVITAVLSFFAIFLGLDRRLWQLMLTSMLARQVVTLMDKHGAATLKTPAFWMDYVRSQRCTREFEGLYIMLCLAFLLLGGPSQQIFIVAAAVYAAVDLATNLGPQLRAAAPPALWDRLGPYMDKLRLNRDALLLNAAAFEGLALFAGLLSGCPIGCQLVVVLFVRFRYNSDPCARMAWHGMYVQAASYAYSPRAPAVIGTIFGYIAGLLHRGATGA